MMATKHEVKECLTMATLTGQKCRVTTRLSLKRKGQPMLATQSLTLSRQMYVFEKKNSNKSVNGTLSGYPKLLSANV